MAADGGGIETVECPMEGPGMRKSLHLLIGPRLSRDKIKLRFDGKT